MGELSLIKILTVILEMWISFDPRIRFLQKRKKKKEIILNYLTFRLGLES